MDFHTVADSLELSLTLAITGNVFTIPGANIKTCHLNLYPYGFDGYLSFWLPVDQRDDTLISPFSSFDLITIELSIIAVHNLPQPAPEPLAVKGLVTTKSVRDCAYSEVQNNPVLHRQYNLHFKDPAQVLWQQHFPTDLVVGSTMETLISAQTPDEIPISIDWDVLQSEQPLICLGLGGPMNHASFYDFLVSYLATHNGLLIYNYGTQTYQITGTKVDDSNATSFLPQDIAQLITSWPETRRHNLNVLNGLADNATISVITQDQAVTGIQHDLLVRQPIQSDLDARKTLETTKLTVRDPELMVDFSQFPLQTFRPGSLFKLDHNTWSPETLYVGTTYRAFQLHLRADAINPSPDHHLDETFTQYHLQYRTWLEPQQSTWICLPPYQSPTYPIYVEGTVISEVGDKADKTYQIEPDDMTAQDQYRISIPLWNKEINVFCEPGFLNPHFYFPLYQGTKLLISLDFDQARIERILAWGARVPLAMETQGNHILFGKNETDETSLQYVYTDGKPVLSLKRILDTDTELVQLEEGTIILQTKEEA